MPPKKKTSSRKTQPDIPVLPTEDTPPRDQLHHYMQLWYGRVKIGKTALAKQFPNTLFLFFEEGGKALSLREMLMLDWMFFQKTVRLLTKGKKHSYQNIVIDTGELAYDACMSHECSRMAIDHPGSEDDYGASWTAVKKEFNKQVLLLNNSGMGVIVNSHEKIIGVKSRKGTEVSRIQPSLSGQALSVIEAMVDVFAYFHFDDDGNRVIQIEGDEIISAGHRLGDDANRFKYPDGSGIERIPMGKSAAEAYTNFVAAFNNELEPTGRKKLTKKKSKKKASKKR